MDNLKHVEVVKPWPVISSYQLNEAKKINLELEDTLQISVLNFPARKLLLKRGIRAKNYFEYCEEVGCNVWGILISVKEALYEPFSSWLLQIYIFLNNSRLTNKLCRN